MNRRAARTALAWFGLQLVLYIAWSWIFFTWRQPGWAFVEIVILWIAILTSRRVNRVAAWLLVPYLLWVSFASFLNGTIWRLNS